MLAINNPTTNITYTYPVFYRMQHWCYSTVIFSSKNGYENIQKNMKEILIRSCSQCGICCRLFLINLTYEEWMSGVYKTELKEFDLDDDFNAVQRYGGNILRQKKDGGCIYLKNNLCSIHKRRPQSCRDFFCRSPSKKFRGMISIIKKRRENDMLR